MLLPMIGNWPSNQCIKLVSGKKGLVLFSATINRPSVPELLSVCTTDVNIIPTLGYVYLELEWGIYVCIP